MPLPIQLAWESFGRANGVASFESLRSAIAAYRGGQPVGPMANIGCTILVEPVFLPRDLWFDLPPSWSQSIQRGKVYSTDKAEGLDLWNWLNDVAQLCGTPVAREMREVQAPYGAPTLITPNSARCFSVVAVTEAYGRQCAITDGKVLPALDAAHIKPFVRRWATYKIKWHFASEGHSQCFRCRVCHGRQKLPFPSEQKGKRGLQNGAKSICD